MSPKSVKAKAKRLSSQDCRCRIGSCTFVAKTHSGLVAHQAGRKHHPKGQLRASPNGLIRNASTSRHRLPYPTPSDTRLTALESLPTLPAKRSQKKKAGAWNFCPHCGYELRG